METVIRANLALAVRLVDTTTGRAIDSADVRFYREELMLRPMYRSGGIWVFVGADRENFSLCIKARDYEVAIKDISFDELDAGLPMCDVFLIPSEKNRKGGQVLSVYGRLSGLKSVDAVDLKRPLCMFRDCTEKKGVVTMNLLTAVQGAKLSLSEGSYMLLSEDLKSYEEFTVVRQDAPVTVVLKSPLKRDYRADCRIFRPIYGRASPDGEFLLRGRDDSDTLPYLLRFSQGDTEWFRPLDLQKEQGEVDLKSGAVQADLPETGKEEQAL